MDDDFATPPVHVRECERVHFACPKAHSREEQEDCIIASTEGEGVLSYQNAAGGATPRRAGRNQGIGAGLSAAVKAAFAAAPVSRPARAELVGEH